MKSLPALPVVSHSFCQVSPSAQVWTMKLSLQAPPFSQALRAELQPEMKGSLQISQTMLRIGRKYLGGFALFMGGATFQMPMDNTHHNGYIGYIMIHRVSHEVSVSIWTLSWFQPFAPKALQRHFFPQ